MCVFNGYTIPSRQIPLGSIEQIPKVLTKHTRAYIDYAVSVRHYGAYEQFINQTLVSIPTWNPSYLLLCLCGPISVKCPTVFTLVVSIWLVTCPRQSNESAKHYIYYKPVHSNKQWTYVWIALLPIIFYLEQPQQKYFSVVLRWTGIIIIIYDINYNTIHLGRWFNTKIHFSRS